MQKPNLAHELDQSKCEFPADVSKDYENSTKAAADRSGKVGITDRTLAPLDWSAAGPRSRRTGIFAVL
jgi:hypothetical protein